MKRLKVIFCLGAFVIFSFLTFTSCNDGKTEKLQSEVDSLRTAVNNNYKPGLGEFMLAVQTHHAKLWFAGINENWPLADFEIGEIRETLDNAIEYLPERTETKDIPIIYPSLDSLLVSVKTKSLSAFTKNYRALTQTCNACHKAVPFDFNVIKTPTSEPVSNQEFKIKK